MREQDAFEKPPLWLRGLVDGVTGAVVLAAIAAAYALIVDRWM